MERKQAEKDLRDSEERFRALFESVQVGVVVTGPNGEVLMANPAALRLLRVTEEEFMGTTSYGPKSSAFFEDGSPCPPSAHPILRAISTRQPVVNVVIGADRPLLGDRVWMLVSAQPQMAPDGTLSHVVCTFFDITESRRAEVQLRQSEADLAEAQRVAKLGNWKLNVADESVKWSQELYHIFDVDKDAFGKVYESFLATVHVDDRERVLNANSKARESGEPFELGYRIVTRSGEVKHIREVGYAMKDTHGGVVGLFGTAQDITEYVRAQRELQQLSGRLLQSQDEERRRIARELHDTTGQNLVALATMLGQLRDLPPQTGRKARKRLSECKTLAEQCIREIRTLSYVLYPPVLEQSGLREAIRDYVKGFTERSGIDVALDLSGRLGRMQLDVELTLFRVMQESLANIQRHSGSKHAKVRINLNSGLTLEVSDPGRESYGGPSKSKPVPQFKSGVGLLSMQERVKSIGGRLQVEITKRGTIVRAVIPMGDKREQTAHSVG